jgi:hypothetical protein
MISFSAFPPDSLRNTLVNHCWWLIWLTFVFAVFYALHDHRELSQKIRESIGQERQAARRKRSVLWCLPVLALIGAAVAQWGSDKADNEIATLGKHLEIARNQQAKAQAAVANLEAKLKPRRFTTEQRTSFLRIAKDAPKCRVQIHCGNVDNETMAFALDIRDLLQTAGYAVDNGVLFDLGNRVTSFTFSGVILNTAVTNLENIASGPEGGPGYYETLGKAFEAMGFQVQGAAVAVPELMPSEIREEYKKRVFDGWGFDMYVPGEVRIIVNDRAY